jgi:hypothetical protein
MGQIIFMIDRRLINTYQLIRLSVLLDSMDLLIVHNVGDAFENTFRTHCRDK